MKAPSAATRLLALLGDPVGHSLSPTFQNAALAAAGLDGVYVALRCGGEDLPGLLHALVRAGGGGNVTVPHKEVAATALERATEAVVRTGACNAFWGEDGVLCGDNTDVVGFVRAANRIVGGGLSGARVLLVGAGGAARAAAWGLVGEGADEIVVLNRSPDRTAALRDRFAGSGTRVMPAADLAALRGERFDFAVNATSLGLREGDPLPLPAEPQFDVAAALDLVYAPSRTPWVRALLDRGVPADDGLEMLLQQGAAAFERWWGIAPPIHAMRAALPAR